MFSSRLRKKNLFSFWRSIWILLGLLAVIGLEISYSKLAASLTDWSKTFYTCLQEKSIDQIAPFAIKYAYLCLISFLAYSASGYLCDMLAVYWRKNIVETYTEKWLDSDHFVEPKFANTDQRIAQDSKVFTGRFVHLAQHFIQSTFILMVFLPKLWLISAQVYQTPGMLVWITVGMSLFSSFGFQATFGAIIRKLQNKIEDTDANLRAHLIFAGMNSVNILLNQGKLVENRLVQDKLEDNIKLNSLKAFWSGIYSFCKGLMNKINVVFPLFLLAPHYLRGEIDFGTLSQITLIFSYVSDALSFWPRHTKEIAGMFTAHARLKSLEEACSTSRSSKIQIHDKDKIEIDIRDLHAGTKHLFSKLQLTLGAGAKVMINGQSGRGKTALVKTLAGINDNYQGHIKLPENTWFTSQSVYIPLLNDIESIVSYPYNFELQDVQRALVLAGLDRSCDVHKLSGGQKQRLLFAKMLLVKPRFIFLDEPTSSLGQADAEQLIGMLYNELPDSCIVLISHQDFLERYHSQIIQL